MSEEKKTPPLSVAITNVLGGGLSVPESASWTDEQWKEHDNAIAIIRRENKQISDAARVSTVLEEMVSRDGWPRRAIEMAVAADLTRSAIVKLAELDTSDRNIIVVSGPAGCGKTVGVAWWALQRKASTKFVRASTFAATSRYDRDERQQWLRANALVLDDAGAEYSDTKGSLMVDLDELIDTFYGDRRPLMITTNCNSAEFKVRFGERISDRLRECGRWVTVEGGTLRRRT